MGTQDIEPGNSVSGPRSWRGRKQICGKKGNTSMEVLMTPPAGRIVLTVREEELLQINQGPEIR